MARKGGTGRPGDGQACQPHSAQAGVRGSSPLQASPKGNGTIRDVATVAGLCFHAPAPPPRREMSRVPPKPDNVPQRSTAIPPYASRFTPPLQRRVCSIDVVSHASVDVSCRIADTLDAEANICFC